MQPRSLFKLWIVAACCQLAGDAALVMTSRSATEPFAWLRPRLTQPVPDSLRRDLSRYLRDSIGVKTQRQGDTLLVIIPPAARQAIDDQLYVARQAGRRAVPWLLGALFLLHMPLLIAIGVTIAYFTGKAAEERNRALREWTEDA